MAATSVQKERAGRQEAHSRRPALVSLRPDSAPPDSTLTDSALTDSAQLRTPRPSSATSKKFASLISELMLGRFLPENQRSTDPRGSPIFSAILGIVAPRSASNCLSRTSISMR